jgi:hypothetical protein
MIQSPHENPWLSYVPHTLAQLSPFYAHLYHQVQQDPELAPFLNMIDPSQPNPILFFSVVNFLVLRDRGHPLARFYPYLTPTPREPQEAYPFFRAFCLAHQRELDALLPTVRLQTNEVGRCAQLLPAFEIVFQRGGGRPLNLIEIGCSAGLNLNWPHYGYRYGERMIGDQTSPVQVNCTLAGEHMPPLPSVLPAVAQCQGIELFPLDLTTEHDIRWLRAAIWPEELERYRLLDAALQVAQRHPPQVLQGEACNRLPELLVAIPAEQTLCIWHSFALNQGPAEVRDQIIQMLCASSVERTIYRISLEVNPTKSGKPRLELFTYHRGDLFQYEWLAECDFHGTSLEWLAPGNMHDIETR